MTRKWQIADVVSKHDTPHYYIIDAGTYQLCQNRVDRCAPNLKGPACNVFELPPTRTIVKLAALANSIPRVVPPWVMKTAVSNVPDATHRQSPPPKLPLNQLHQVPRGKVQGLCGELEEIKATSGRVSS